MGQKFRQGSARGSVSPCGVDCDYPKRKSDDVWVDLEGPRRLLLTRLESQEG